MLILGIETSCDETSVAVVKASGSIKNPDFSVLGNSTYSQVKIHEKYGGVFPTLAKREHAKNLVPLLKKTLKESELFAEEKKLLDKEKIKTIQKITERELGLFEALMPFLHSVRKPVIDAIAVTHGPGLEPALWVGINFARALSIAWNIPAVPINHMEGHIVSVLLSKKVPTGQIEFPVIALLISGGHTELVLVKDWTKYKILGETRDDAVGEAFDKVGRMLGLPYPGGPEISKLAQTAGVRGITSTYHLPRPMINSADYDFSFAGLKTAVLYLLKKLPKPTLEMKQAIAKEFEDAICDVLIAKTKKALEEFMAKSLILGGGVAANLELRSRFLKLKKQFPDTEIYFPEIELSTDNAVMIAMAFYLHSEDKFQSNNKISAESNLKLGSIN